MLLAHQKPRLQPLLGSFGDNFTPHAFEISQSGLLAVGNHEYISIFDISTNQILQILYNQTPHAGVSVNAQSSNVNSPISAIQIVRWSHENYHHDLMSPYLLRLAVVNALGYITVWEVAKASVLCEFRHAHTQVCDLHWVEKQDSSHDLLIGLHSPSDVILWNADTGTQLWRRNYQETLYRFHVDPYDTKNIVFLANKCILLINDFSFGQAPVGNARKFHISGPGGGAGDMVRSTSDNLISRSSQILHNTLKLVKGTAGESASTSMGKLMETVGGGKTASGTDSADILDVQFHASLRGHLLILFPRELLLLDMLLSQTVASVRLEPSASPFMQMYSCRQGDFLYCLHANGCITLRGRQPRLVPHPQVEEDEFILPPYHICAQTEPARLNRHVQVAGFCVDPRGEMETCLLTTDGKIQMWSVLTHAIPSSRSSGDSDSLLAQYHEMEEPGDKTPPILNENAATGQHAPAKGPLLSGPELGHLTFKQPAKLHLSPRSNQRKAEFWRLFDVMAPLQIRPISDSGTEDSQLPVSGQLHFVMYGHHVGVLEDVRLMSMCPPPKRSTATTYQPLLALASGKGLLQVWHLGFNSLQHEVQVFPGNCTPVHGLEWLTDRLLLLWHTPVGLATASNASSPLATLNSSSTSTPNSVSGSSGATNSPSSGSSTSPGVHTRNGTSQLRNDFCLLYLDSGQVVPLRRKHVGSANLNISEPPVKEVRISHLRQYMLIVFDGDKPAELWDVTSLTLLHTFRDGPSRVILAEWTNLRGQSLAGSPQKESHRQESVVFVDHEHYIHLYQVEGALVNKKSSIPIGNGVTRVSALAWKDDLIVLGDVDGNVLLWNLKAKLTQNHSLTAGGAVKKLKFAFGKNARRLMVLQADVVEVWHITAETLNRVHMRFHRDWPSVVNMEWVDSAHICGAFQDGVLRMFDTETFTEENLPLVADSLKEPILQPALLPPKVNLLLQVILQNQPENGTYSLGTCPTLANGFEKVATQVNDFLQNLSKRGLRESFEGDGESSPVPSIAQRCYLTALLFGDEYETRFWSVVVHFHSLQRGTSTSVPNSLGLGFDSLCEERVFRAHQALRVSHLEAKKTTEEQARKCVEALIMLGQLERAIKELINANPEQSGSHYLKDVYKACLLSSLMDSQLLGSGARPKASPATTSTNTHKAMKTAAVSLISNGELSEGVQILCSIGLLQEACHYLMSYQKWDMALWLAKCSMEMEERTTVLQKWAGHLRSPQVNEKSLALLVLVSLGQHKEVLENLYSLRHFTMATRYLEACTEAKLLDKYPPEDIRSLQQAVYLEFARHLMTLGYRASALHYCALAGEKGNQLRKEVDFLIGD